MSDKNNGNYFIVFQSKHIYGKYSKIEDSQRYSNNAPLVYDNSTLLKQVFPYDIYTVGKTDDTIVYNNTINFLAFISYGAEAGGLVVPIGPNTSSVNCGGQTYYTRSQNVISYDIGIMTSPAKADTYNISMSVGQYSYARTNSTLSEFGSLFGAIRPTLPIKSSRSLDFTCSISSNIFMPATQSFKFNIINLPTYTAKPYIVATNFGSVAGFT